MKTICYILPFLLLSLLATAQTDISAYCGTYGDMLLANGEISGTELVLRADGTFKLKWVDNVYPQSFEYYTNEGNWIIENEEVILNQNLKRRYPQISIREKRIGLKDSIQIKVNHFVERHENEKLLDKKKTEFELLTIFLNKKRNYLHLSRASLKTSNCAFAPRIRNRINLDATNTFKILKEDIQKIGVYTYGFTDFIELELEKPGTDYYEIDVVVPLDIERMPRSKKVMIKGKRAYFYEWKGEVRKSFNHLVKIPATKL